VTTADLRAAPLNYIAPDIIVAIVDGRQPTDLRLAELLCSGPLDWNEQRANWGFSK
jgi:site-specific DNA recombinase